MFIMVIMIVMTTKIIMLIKYTIYNYQIWLLLLFNIWLLNTIIK